MKKEYVIEAPSGFRAEHIEQADSFFTRFCGLMCRAGLPEGGGLLLRECGSIHCCFMRFTIDVVYLDENMKILAVETVRPWRIGSLIRGARHVLELREGAAAALTVGETLQIKETEKRV